MATARRLRAEARRQIPAFHAAHSGPKRHMAEIVNKFLRPPLPSQIGAATEFQRLCAILRRICTGMLAVMLLLRLLQDRRAAVAPMFALTLIPLIAAGGAA